MFQLYQRIRIINLPERVDRRRDMTRELTRVGLAGDDRVAFFPAIRPADQGPFRSIGVHGVYLSHLTLLKEAAAAGESLLILEDDCDFTDAVADPRPPPDLLWGGYAIYPSHIEGAHCMGFSAATTKLVANYLEDLLRTGPIDVDGAYIWFCRDHPAISVDACNPMIAVQRPSQSDISEARKFGSVPKPLLSIGRALKRIRRRTQGSAEDFEALLGRLRTESSNLSEP